jgi:hypothetical protein
MPLRNLWALEPDEIYAAEEAKNHLKDSDIYFPAHDSGTDFIIVKGKKHVAVQVKGSRYYTSNAKGSIPRNRWHTWHQIKAKKIGGENGVDFYVFVAYVPKMGEHKVSSFDTKFVVVPAGEIERRVRLKKPGENNVYSFYFRFEDNKVTEIREGRDATGREFDYSKFLDDWEQIEESLR